MAAVPISPPVNQLPISLLRHAGVQGSFMVLMLVLYEAATNQMVGQAQGRAGAAVAAQAQQAHRPERPTGLAFLGCLAR